MKASELRTGNSVLFSADDFKSQAKEHCIVGRDIQVMYAIERDFQTESECYRPIPITEKYLKSVGFIIDVLSGNYWKNCATHYLELIKEGDEVYPVWVTLPELSSESEQRSTTNVIQYVHQLQNLYFALTGEELIQPQV